MRPPQSAIPIDERGPKMLTEEKLAEVKEKAKESGLSEEFNLLIRDTIGREKRAAEAEERNAIYLGTLQQIALAFNISTPLTDQQVRNLPVQVKGLKDRSVMAGESLRTWIFGFCVGKGIEIPEDVVTAEQAIKFLAGMVVVNGEEE